MKIEVSDNGVTWSTVTNYNNLLVKDFYEHLEKHYKFVRIVKILKSNFKGV